MEEWTHDENTKDKVNSTTLMVDSVLRKFKKKTISRKCGNEWNLPKFHGMSKMVEYIRFLGAARIVMEVWKNHTTSTL